MMYDEVLESLAELYKNGTELPKEIEDKLYIYNPHIFNVDVPILDKDKCTIT